VNLSEFTSQVNAVREHYDTEAGDAVDIDSIGQPSAVGSLEYPNAQDDALSILDRERFLTLWLEARRFNDLTRWDHPFRDGGTVVYTSNIVSQRATIMPVAESECNNNENVECPDQEVYTP
jgi:hypothetical protein